MTDGGKADLSSLPAQTKRMPRRNTERGRERPGTQPQVDRLPSHRGPGCGFALPCTGLGYAVIFTALVTFLVVCALALAFPPGIGREISFVSPYRPRPEWYFLWMYQAARYVAGAWAFVWLVLLPAALGAGLALLPAIDGDSRGGRRRAIAVCLLIGVGLLGLSLPTLID